MGVEFKYRKVSPSTWTDRFFKSLSTEGRLLWMYLLTSPQTTPFGLYRFSKGQAADDTGLPADTVTTVLEELTARGGDQTVRFDERSRLIFLPNWLRYNPPSNPNVVKSWVAQLREIPQDSPFLYDWLKALEGCTMDLGDSVQETLWSTVTDSVGLQEQEQEQEQEQMKKRPPTMSFNYLTGKWNRRPTEAERLTWDAAYPDINIDREWAKATAWLISNPDRRKVRFAAFLNGWFARAQGDREGRR